MISKKNIAYYTDPTQEPTVGNRIICYHIYGHPSCTPNHHVYTSPITWIGKNGRFHTQNTIWIRK